MKSPPARRRKDLGTPCPTCLPRSPQSECPICNGLGWTPLDPRKLIDQVPLPEFLEETQEVLIARVGIEKYGVQGWMLLNAVEPSECLGEALGIIDGELERLERDGRGNSER